jgi:predicted ribosomally synthesized peptide with SipW-like signal peptide
MRTKSQVLVSLVVISIAALAAASTTTAYFNDTESSQDNTFTAGALDLQIDWNESYNGDFVEEQPLTDNPGPIFDLNDVKPGDEGEATISLHLFDNPGWVWMRMNVTFNDDVSSTEPELEVDEPDDPNDAFDGELLQNINFTLWYDDGDNVHEDGERVIQREQLAEEECRVVGGLDAGLVIDRSGSMSGTKLQEAKDGSKTLVDTIASSDQSALASFSSDATLDQELTTDKSVVKNAINSLNSGGGTDIGSGVNLAHEELINGTNARDNATKVMVVLSDGKSSGDPVAASDAAKQDGIRLVTIALGSGADEALLEEMASSDEDAYVAPNATTLTSVFEDISQTICESPEEDLQTALQNGILLDGEPSTQEADAMENSTTQYIGFKWELPASVGNEVQTDETRFDLDFHAQQRRHVSSPENPFN